MFDHFVRVMDRALKRMSYRREVERLIEASEDFSAWRQSRGQDPTHYTET